MKKIILLLVMLFPMVANAIKIEKNEVDDFTGNRTVVTSWERFCGKTIVYIRFSLENNEQFLDYKMVTDGAIVIPKDAKLMIKSDESMATLNSIDTYSGGKGQGAVGMNASGCWGIFATYTGDLSWFGENSSEVLRAYASGEYYDRKFSDKDGEKLKSLYLLFADTIANN